MQLKINKQKMIFSLIGVLFTIGMVGNCMQANKESLFSAGGDTLLLEAIADFGENAQLQAFGDSLSAKLGADAYQIDLSWTIPEGYSGILLIREVGFATTDISNGTEVYRGSDSSITDNVFSTLTQYYTAYLLDASGNPNLSFSKTIPIAPAGKIYLYSAGFYSGRLGNAPYGRAGADAACILARPTICQDAGDTNNRKVRAFVSLSGSDSLLNLPDLITPDPLNGNDVRFSRDIPIVSSVNGQVLAGNWADLFDGLVNAIMGPAGMNVIGAGDFWWSFTNTNGTTHGNTCLGGTSNLVGQSGRCGNSGGLDFNYIDWGNDTCDISFNKNLLCMCTF